MALLRDWIMVGDNLLERALPHQPAGYSAFGPHNPDFAGMCSGARVFLTLRFTQNRARR